MLSLDEAIKMYKEITNTDAICPAHCNISCDKCVQESEQLTEWLEELKELRATSFGYRKEDIELNRNAMYNKAIDDLTANITERFFGMAMSSGLPTEGATWENAIRQVKQIAEQLKVGGTE